MALKYRIFSEKRLVYARSEGPLSSEELLAHLHNLAIDPSYRPPMKKLVDYRLSGLQSLSQRDAEEFTELKRSMGPIFQGEVYAIVVATDLDFGLSRVHGSMIETANMQTEVFRDIDEALSWLEVDIPVEALSID